MNKTANKIIMSLLVMNTISTIPESVLKNLVDSGRTIVNEYAKDYKFGDCQQFISFETYNDSDTFYIMKLDRQALIDSLLFTERLRFEINEQEQYANELDEKIKFAKAKLKELKGLSHHE